jgi:ferredoxin-NADP reductase
MTAYDVQLRRRQQVAHGTTAFHFDKPAGFTFKPGQAVDLVLPASGVAGAAEQRHAFSIVSAPFESELVLATRMRDSAFKNALKDLPLGTRLGIDGPFGSLTLHNKHDRAAVFIAGGIGITPFMSLLRQAAHDQRPQPLALLYSNRRPEDSAFLSELQEMARVNPRLRLLPTMTQMDQSTLAWDGERGQIDGNLLRQVAMDLPAPVYYLAGPPTMVSAVRTLLESAGVDDDDVRLEEFYGY